MKPSLKVFLKEIIDYAGLFPPAELSLDTAIQNYNNYRKTDDSWMLSRFIIPASGLQKLKPYGKNLFSEGRPFDFSVLGKGTETVDEFYDQLDEIVQALNQFHETHGNHVTTDMLEVKLPREAVFANDTALLLEIFAEVTERMNESDKLPDNLFFEGYFEENWKKDISHILQTLHKHNEQFSMKDIHAGFKVRCGGVKASLFPSPEQLAFTLNRTKEENIALKCTAGLHHPVRHYDDSVQTKMHGFFNVFGGAMLGYAHDLSDEELLEILNEEDSDHFSFTDGGFSWMGKEIPTNEIQELRETALISFGSCSFNEPREDLQSLGLL
ncbi:MAG TPA: hypothetical protein VF181_11050 [Balneolaceae bacterium]